MLVFSVSLVGTSPLPILLTRLFADCLPPIPEESLWWSNMKRYWHLVRKGSRQFNNDSRDRQILRSERASAWLREARARQKCKKFSVNVNKVKQIAGLCFGLLSVVTPDQTPMPLLLLSGQYTLCSLARVAHFLSNSIYQRSPSNIGYLFLQTFHPTGLGSKISIGTRTKLWKECLSWRSTSSVNFLESQRKNYMKT